LSDAGDPRRANDALDILRRRDPMTAPRTGHRLLATVALALAAVLATVGVALGTPPGGTSTKTTLADVTIQNTVNAQVDPIKLRTKDSVEVAQFGNTAQPGFSSGWHEHTGPVLITVTAGALTFYDRAGAVGSACRVTVVTAGQGYIETPGEPILVRNEGSVEADWITTQIIPVGASQRVDTAGFCGVL
jgi:hypothetical protein